MFFFTLSLLNFPFLQMSQIVFPALLGVFSSNATMDDNISLLIFKA